MQYIKMKIISFDETSYSLFASYASDETKSDDPSNYPPYAYQPMNMWPDIDDPEEIKRRIALAGVWVAQNQAREERFIANPAKVAQYRAMVGQIVQYPIDPTTGDLVYENEVLL